MKRLFLSALAMALLSLPAAAQDPPTLSFPADCTIGADCWMLSFVDLDDGDAYTDHTCGARTYAAHKGTDVALIDPRHIDRNIAVRVVADGVVLGVRDGEPDNPMDQPTSFAAGKECGNGVRVDHGGGWTTQYCHLKKGSVRARSGQELRAGTVLGAIGNSGASETPHVHVQLEKDGRVIDPFLGRSPSSPAACETGTPLWSEQALAAFGEYKPSFIRYAGFGTGKMTVRDVQGTPAPERLPRSGEALSFYAMVYGAPEGGVLTLEIMAPSGQRVIDHRVVMDATKARQFSLVGRKTPDGGWPPGPYRGIARFSHDGNSVVHIATVFLE